MEYELVLGLEIHLQLNTLTKMFCSCKNDPFNSEANANVCPVCLGLPGAMPVPNLEAIKAAQLMAHHLGSQLQKEIIFERKNYSYPDLPKGFQITCPHWPIAVGGSYNNVNWREIHLEEDTAKSIHSTNETQIDFNKSGVPLLEMVTEPGFHDIDQAVEFCKEIQLMARYLKVSEADMEKGNMRLEANISVREKGKTDLPNYRVELKNINSFAFMKKALQYELRRQSEALAAGEKLSQETRGFNENTGKTFLQRSKEEAHDYRYFPEPDIPRIEVDAKWLEEITTSQLATPNAVRSRLISYKLSEQYVNTLVNDIPLAIKHEELVTMGTAPYDAASWIINKPAYKTLEAASIIEAEKAKKADVLSDASELEAIVDNVISGNEKAVNDFKSGNANSLQFLIGQIMKESKGKADVAKAREIILQKLS